MVNLFFLCNVSIQINFKHKVNERWPISGQRSIEIGVLKDFTKFTGKHLFQEHLFYRTPPDVCFCFELKYLYYIQIIATKMKLLLSSCQEHCVKSVQIRGFFWSVFSRIRTEYGDLLRKFVLRNSVLRSDFKSVSDHFGALCIKRLSLIYNE